MGLGGVAVYQGRDRCEKAMAVSCDADELEVRGEERFRGGVDKVAGCLSETLRVQGGPWGKVVRG